MSACNAVGFGPWSHGATLHTASTPGTSGGNTIGTTNNQWCGIAAQGSDGTPGTPNPPTVTAGGTDSITVQWTAPQDDGGSQIKIYAVQFTQVGISTMVKEPGLSTTLTGLQANTDYSRAGGSVQRGRNERMVRGGHRPDRPKIAALQ